MIDNGHRSPCRRRSPHQTLSVAVVPWNPVKGRAASADEAVSWPMDRRSFRAQLKFSIGFAISRSRTLWRRILAEHAPDEARQQLAERVVKHLEQSGFDLDEEG